MNTLKGSNRPATQQTPRRQGYGKKTSHAFSPQTLAFETHRGDNVPPQETYHDFPDRDSTSAKRRKIQDRPTHEPPTSSPVHVLDSDDEVAPPESIQNRTVTRVPPSVFSATAPRTQPSHASNRKSPFESFGLQSEFRLVNKRVNSRPPKQQRITVFEKNLERPEMAVRKASQPAERAPQSSPIYVEDDSTQPDSRGTDLSKGLSLILKDADRRPVRDENRERHHDTMSLHFLNGGSEVTESAPREAKTPSTNGKLRRPRPLNGERSPPLHSVKDRQMAAAQAARAAREANAYDSPDELQSKTTVGSSSATVQLPLEIVRARAQSPQKNLIHRPSVSPERAPETIRSPNDIQRTKFVRSRKVAIDPPAAKPKSRRKIEQPPIVWPLLIYGADGLTLVREGLQLHWYTDRRLGIVTVDEQPPNFEDTAACIYPRKLQSAVRGPPDCAKVQLSGSKGQDVSYSRDLAFAQPSDLNEFMTNLEDATKGTLKTYTKPT